MKLSLSLTTFTTKLAMHVQVFFSKTAAQLFFIWFGLFSPLCVKFVIRNAPVKQGTVESSSSYTSSETIQRSLNIF